MAHKLKKELELRARQVAKGAENLSNLTRDWQVIKEYMCNRLNTITLTDDQQAKLDRYQYMYNQLVSGKYTEGKVISQVMNLYKISYATAYADLRDTHELFNSCINLDKTFMLKQQAEIAQDIITKCLLVGDFKNANAAQKNLTAILRELRVDDTSPGEHYEGINIEVVFDPTLIGGDPITKKDFDELVKEINKNRTKKIDPKFIEDLDFEMR